MLSKDRIAKGVLEIVQTLQKSGYKSYLVGGSVRDLLLGLFPDEWDLTTNAKPDEVSKLFKKVVPTGIKFGTVTILLEDGNYEVTTFRFDQRYVDGRHPESVNYASDIEEDLSRRDFTINAMAYDPGNEKLVDKYNGEKDLAAKTIRAVGNPMERFSEDGLRSIRACRFAAQLGFEVEEKTKAAISATLDITKKVAPERVHDELVKMLTKADKPSIAFKLMLESGLLQLLIPELVETSQVEQPKEFHKYDVFHHAIYACDAAPKSDLVVRLAALLHDISKPFCKEGDHFYGHENHGSRVAAEILKRFRFGRDIIDAVENLIKNHMFNYTGEWSDAAVRRMMQRVGVPNLESLFLLRLADTSAMEREIDSNYLKELKTRIDKIIDEENALHVSDLKVNGSDVMEIRKISSGPEVGKILNWLLEKVLDDPKLNERETLLKMVRDYCEK